MRISETNEYTDILFTKHLHPMPVTVSLGCPVTTSANLLGFRCPYGDRSWSKDGWAGDKTEGEPGGN